MTDNHHKHERTIYDRHSFSIECEMDFEGDVPVTDRESGKWDNMILQKVALNIDNEVKIDITQRLTKQELEQIKKTLV
jgi:hypothetical protein